MPTYYNQVSNSSYVKNVYFSSHRNNLFLFTASILLVDNRALIDNYMYFSSIYQYMSAFTVLEDLEEICTIEYA